VYAEIGPSQIALGRAKQSFSHLGFGIVLVWSAGQPDAAVCLSPLLSPP